MDEFKIKSIEEFDKDFIAMLNEKSNADISSDSQGVIPEVSKDIPEEETEVQTPPQPKEQPPANNVQDIPVQNKVMYSPVSPQTSVVNNTKNKTENKKQSGGILAGKIISILLLVSTVVVFILGCVAITFVDNEGANIAGICINTASADVVDDNGVLYISEGDLIFSKKGTIDNYKTGELVVMKSTNPNANGKSDVMLINGIASTSEDEALLYLTNRTTNSSQIETISSKATYGVFMKMRIPMLGNILHFIFDSMLNSILVCVLFVLVISLWCLMIILLSSKGKAKNKKQ